MTPRTLNYGNYGIFLIMGNAGFCPSTVRTAPGSVVLSQTCLPIRPRILGCTCGPLFHSVLGFLGALNPAPRILHSSQSVAVGVSAPSSGAMQFITVLQTGLDLSVF